MQSGYLGECTVRLLWKNPPKGDLFPLGSSDYMAIISIFPQVMLLKSEVESDRFLLRKHDGSKFT